ncbi:LysR family transcriptional regulator [Hoeflea sp. TYP-13]|uniref:LysR family transcriptional regulator n=1 Tax=Hoeflea sp. TYP-13 TaxID=3230023 RepID=UPI0034C5CE2A
MVTRRIPSLNWLRVFDAAARMESFARAAELLNMSPPAVSQQIRALEGYLGRPLFSRGAKQVTLTDAGRTFLPVVSQALASVETSAAAIFGARETQQLNIQVVTVLASNWLPERLSSFEKMHPNIRLQITSGNSIQDFRNSDAHLQIAFGSATDFPQTAERLFGETIYPVARPDIAAQINTASDFTRHRLIEVAPHRSGWFQLLQNRISDDLHAAEFCLVDNTVIALGTAAAGRGIALARAPATDSMVRAYGLVPCMDDFSIRGLQHYYLFDPATAPPPPAANAFRTWLIEEAAAVNA